MDKIEKNLFVTVLERIPFIYRYIIKILLEEEVKLRFYNT